MASSGGYIFLFIVLICIVIWYLNYLLKYKRYNKAYYNIVKEVNKKYYNWDPKRSKTDKLREKFKPIEEYDKKENWEEAEIKDKGRKIKVPKSVLKKRSSDRKSRKQNKSKSSD